MSIKRKIINTPELLNVLRNNTPTSNTFIQSSSTPSPNDGLTPKEKEKSLREKRKQIAKKTQLEDTVTTIKDELPTPESELSSNKKRLETQPSNFPISNNQQRSKMKTIKRIVLHHTAGHMKNDHGEKTCKEWYSNNLGSHSLIDTDGHTEYVVPLPFGANTQGQNLFVNGVKKTPKGGNFNNSSISTELVNLGYLNKNYKGFNGLTYWYRSSVGKNTSFEEKTETSSGYSFNLLPLNKYKGHLKCVEYTDPQLNAMVAWIKEMQTYIANNYPSSKEILNWRFTQETYNQLFPNTNGKNIPKNFKQLGGEIIQGEYLIAGQTKSKPKNTNPYAWAVSKDVYSGKIGIYTHNSITAGKSDIFPTKKMVQCLKLNF